MEQKPDDETEKLANSSLEDEPALAPAPGSSDTPETTDATGGQVSRPARLRTSIAERLLHTNLYFIIFALLLLLAAGVAAVLYVRSHQVTKAVQTLPGQSLSAGSLQQLANSGTSVGDPKQVLTVQSNAIFANKVLVRGDLEVAGKILVGSSLNLTGINVSGNSTFDDVQVSKSMSITGNQAVKGKITSASLAASGNGSFGGSLTAGQITTNSLNLNGNLNLTHHLIGGGPSPGRSNGGALGSGGTSSVSGSDTAGSVSINTGSSPAAGCYLTVNFAQRYDATPHVLVTPVGSGAAAVNFYVSKSTNGFSICGASPAGAGQSFGFDYFVIE